MANQNNQAQKGIGQQRSDTGIYTWFLLVVGFGLAPFICAYVLDSSSASSLLPATLVHGELLIFSIALFGDTLHELVRESSKLEDAFTKKIAATCLLTLICVCFLLAATLQQDVAIAKEQQQVMVTYTNTNNSITQAKRLADALTSWKRLANTFDSWKESEDKSNANLVIAGSAIAFFMAVGAGMAIRWKRK